MHETKKNIESDGCDNKAALTKARHITETETEMMGFLAQAERLT